MVKYSVSDIPMLEKDVAMDFFLYERAKKLLENFSPGSCFYISMEASMHCHKYYYDLELAELNRLKKLSKSVVDGQLSIFDKED